MNASGERTTLDRRELRNVPKKPDEGFVLDEREGQTGLCKETNQVGLR